MHALLTIEEGEYFLKTLCNPNPHQSWKDAIFSCTDPTSVFFGSLVESLSVSRIVLEIRGFGVTATEYMGKNGSSYIRLSGYAGIRKYLDATRYLIDNPKILDIGIGTQGIENGIVRGARFCIVFSAAYRSVELLLKDEYGLADFFVNLTLDAAKLGVSIGVAWGAKALATGFMVAGTGVIFIAAGIFLVGFGVSLLLYWLDNEYKISETIIKNIKTHRAHNTPYHPDQLFSAWGRFSRG
ncbi:membrane protein [Yersinia similis]|nr:membrane protein [Yersinia similis]